MSIEDVVCAARRGDHAAREQLVIHFAPHVTRYVTLHMGARARRWTDSADIASQVLYEVLGDPTKLPDHADADEVARRLNQVATWRILDAIRDNRHHRGPSELGDGPAGAVESPTTGAVTRADQRRWIEELVERLSGDARQIVRLIALEGLSYPQAGERLGLSSEVVRKRYARARDRLAGRLARGERARADNGRSRDPTPGADSD